MTLSPRPGFDWMAVSWGGPNEPVSETCSYCDAEIPEESVPLILWNAEGWCARFCDTCQEKWWGMTILKPFDDDDDPRDEPDDTPSLGPCCICAGEVNVKTIVMLPVRNLVPGHGWGCLTCGLPHDGASAVLCEPCREKWEAGEPLRFACRGYPAQDGRVSIDALTEPHKHDQEKHRDDDL